MSESTLFAEELRLALRSLPVPFNVIACEGAIAQRKEESLGAEKLLLIYIHAGSGTLSRADGVTVIEDGNLILLSGGCDYTLRGDGDRGISYTRVLVELSGRLMPLTVLPSGRGGESRFLRADAGDEPWYEQQFRLIYHEFINTRGEFRRGFCSSLVHTLLSRVVLDITHLARPHAVSENILNVCSSIRREPAYRFSIDEMAEIAHYSPAYFPRVFKRETGLSPKEYEIRSRLAYARFLMKEYGRNVSEASLACGYEDPSIFSKQYKKVYGVPPREHRRDERGAV